ncbi:copper amine oxidase N-terminal domain-containing protein [Cytobacillus massiliigabonensis]|uniref:copper amine oxidase N-terminal domain-containing protein n=1 Tax=Cytobacillus massiliigabonensis TaxID=1871011 RepID=UPI000C84EF44|nr:copper amine oxidase N-terminal domain-containing protein [Cytobacillus massiliigabonensis]
MKKLSALVTATLITGLVISTNSAVASSHLLKETQNDFAKQKDIQSVDSTDFMKFSGLITDVKKDKESLTLIVENKDDSLEMHFPLSDKVLLFNSDTTDAFDKDDLVKGLTITAYYDKNKPMIMIYPPRVTPEIIVVNGKEMGQVKVSKFDDQYISLDNELKLNIDEETILLNKQGDKVKKEKLQGKELIVFYDISTKSIPAQTTPKKIIAWDNRDQLFEQVQEVVGDDYYIKDGMKLLPIKKVAEHLGYKVKWDSKNAAVELSIQNQTIQIFIGKEKYSLNRSLRSFEVVPAVINDEPFVSEEILEILLNNQ